MPLFLPIYFVSYYLNHRTLRQRFERRIYISHTENARMCVSTLYINARTRFF
nr:MAG TPA: hypothetical protein [Caudoviricetes sp.]